jgi:hypothetical protein
MTMKNPLIVAIALGLLALWAAPAQAQQQVAAEFQAPLKLKGTVESLYCTNNTGPQINFSGEVEFPGGVTVQFIFRNNEKGTHEDSETTTADVTMTPAGGTITIPKQPVLGGVGGNPFIWIQLMDGQRTPLTGEIYMGRCVQGPVEAEVYGVLDAVANVSVTDCTNNPGPYISMDGGLSLGRGLMARFIFRNNDNPVGGPHKADAVSDITLVPAGYTIRIPKQPVEGGVGGNPWISVQYLSGTQAVGRETLLGRCVQLLPGN